MNFHLSLAYKPKSKFLQTLVNFKGKYFNGTALNLCPIFYISDLNEFVLFQVQNKTCKAQIFYFKLRSSKVGILCMSLTNFGQGKALLRLKHVS